MKNRYVVFVVVVLALFLMERKGYCDDARPVQDIPPGDDVIVGLSEGQKAPFTGQLFDPATALRWANWLQQYKYFLKTEVEMERRVCAADKALADRRLAIEQEKGKTVADDLRKTLAARDARIVDLEKAADSPPFYRTVWFGTVLGVVATGALIGVGVWAAK